MTQFPIETRSLSFGFDGQNCLNEVSLKIPSATLTALMGPNGSGKSTLLKLMAGLLTPLNSDQIRIDGTDLASMNRITRAQHVAYVGSELSTQFPITVSEVIGLGRVFDREVNHELLSSCMAELQLAHLSGRILSSLSGGQKQLVALARAIYQGSKTLLLDEATSQMDLDHQYKVGALLQSLVKMRGYTIIWVSHDVNLAAEWCDRVVVLDRGALLGDGPIDQWFRPEVFEKLYPQCKFSLGVHPKTGAPKLYSY
jgi:iron complex transport system ATP-binding protein